MKRKVWRLLSRTFCACAKDSGRTPLEGILEYPIIGICMRRVERTSNYATTWVLSEGWSRMGVDSPLALVVIAWIYNIENPISHIVQAKSNAEIS
jgi:hypothetical protein